MSRPPPAAGWGSDVLLSKLSTPCLDFLLLHRINAHTLRILPQAEKLAEQKEEKCDLEKKTQPES